ncbi:ribosome maturation factor RimP [Williamsia muralis]|uniref:ribosome maturation factor RimP n=1 Tax=Williamsia marianensis TaxID=85044 RepID=UPI0038263A7E
MPGAIDHDRISALLEPIAAQNGYDVEELTVSASGAENVVKVVVDRDGGATLDELAALSRSISEVLDAPAESDDSVGDTTSADPVAAFDTYVLEVTSPGVDRPLMAARHWRRAAGRKVVVDLVGEPPERVAGRVGRLADDENSVSVVIKSGRGLTTRQIELAAVRKAFVQVDFGEPSPAELEKCGLDPEQIEARRKGNK